MSHTGRTRIAESWPHLSPRWSRGPFDDSIGLELGDFCQVSEVVDRSHVMFWWWVVERGGRTAGAIGALLRTGHRLLSISSTAPSRASAQHDGRFAVVVDGLSGVVGAARVGIRRD